VSIIDVYVEADGDRLGRMAERLGDGEVGISVGATYGPFGEQAGRRATAKA
jgi:hypothetical protein